MEKAYDIKQVRFENDYIILEFNNQILKLRISEISTKLAKASKIEREDYKISPSGYGIHWRLIDEDLSINGLLNR